MIEPLRLESFLAIIQFANETAAPFVGNLLTVRHTRGVRKDPFVQRCQEFAANINIESNFLQYSRALYFDRHGLAILQDHLVDLSNGRRGHRLGRNPHSLCCTTTRATPPPFVLDGGMRDGRGDRRDIVLQPRQFFREHGGNQIRADTQGLSDFNGGRTELSAQLCHGLSALAFRGGGGVVQWCTTTSSSNDIVQNPMFHHRPGQA